MLELCPCWLVSIWEQTLFIFWEFLSNILIPPGAGKYFTLTQWQVKPFFNYRHRCAHRLCNFTSQLKTEVKIQCQHTQITGSDPKVLFCFPASMKYFLNWFELTNKLRKKTSNWDNLLSLPYQRTNLGLYPWPIFNGQIMKPDFHFLLSYANQKQNQT